MVAVFGILVFAAGWWLHRGTLPDRLKGYLEPEARARYQQLPPSQREALARAQLPLITELETAGWEPRATQVLAAADGGPPQLVYDLAGEHTGLRGCRFDLSREQPQGQCGGGFSYLPARERRKWIGSEWREVVAPLVVQPGPGMFAESPGDLEIPVTDDVLTRGRVQVSPDDVRLLDGELRIPHPLREEPFWGPIRELSLVVDLDIVTRADVHVDLALPMPTGMQPIPLARLDAEVTVDLRPEDGLFLLEGSAQILGRGSGQLRVMYFPGRYASFQIAAMTFPVAPPYLCIGMESLLIEADVEQERFRVNFSTEVGSSQALVCAFIDERTSVPGREFLVSGVEWLLEWTRESFETRTGISLPQAFHAGGQLVLDVGDGVMCLDLGMQRTSLLKGAYFLASKTLVTEAPVRLSSDLSGPEGFYNLVSGLDGAPASFPEMDPAKCWAEDPGPRVDALRREIDARLLEVGG